jgi:hypothetical protein
MNDGLQLQLAELAGSSKSRDAVAADTRAQLELIYRWAAKLHSRQLLRRASSFAQPRLHPTHRNRIDFLQREVSDLNTKLVAAAARHPHDENAAEWAPYFQAAQRDHAQKIEVRCHTFEPFLQPNHSCSQELKASHAHDLRLLQEANDRERALWEKEVDAALKHVKVNNRCNLCF